MLRRFIVLCLVGFSVLGFTENRPVSLERLPVSRHPANLQHGAKLVVNYCLGCHTMRSVRMASLEALRLTDQQIKENLLLNGGRLDQPVAPVLSPDYFKRAFGTEPPDLSLIVKAKTSPDGNGGDWLYTYLKRFYWDPGQPFGWNNFLQPGTAMPHVLYALDNSTMWLTSPTGQRLALPIPDAEKMTPLEYDEAAADIANFLAYVADPSAETRRHVGFYVMGFLLVLFMLIYKVKIEFWKSV